MNLKHLFLSFEGRISRKPYWIALLILIAIQLFGVAVGLFVLGLPLETFLQQDNQTLTQINLGAGLILLYPSLAITIKRLHDRNRSGWWGTMFYALSVANNILSTTSYAGTAGNLSTSQLALLALLGIGGLWLLVELGFLRGTAGENRFGQDPLGGESAQHGEAPAGQRTDAPVSRPIDWGHLFFGFSGRISRKPFWIGLIIIVAAGATGIVAVLVVLGALVADTSTEAAGVIILAPILVIGIVMAVSSLAVSIKRLHDRNKSGWWMALYYALLIAQSIAVSSKMMARPGTSGTISIGLALFNFAIVIYYIVELGFLKGKRGPNHYGPDPLGAKGTSGQGDASF